MSKDRGGPAFPVPLNPGERYDVHGPADGMTLRDYFAAKAMQGALANPEVKECDPQLRLAICPTAGSEELEALFKELRRHLCQYG